MVRAGSGKTLAARRKRTRKLTKGFRLGRHNLYKQASITLIRSRVFAFRDRKAKKRQYRRLWIVRINAACRTADISYSKFIGGLRKAGVELNRKVLADIAASDDGTFRQLVDQAKAALEKA